LAGNLADDIILNMYKTTILEVKLDTKSTLFNPGNKNLEKIAIQLEDYINTFSKEGWDLVHMTKTFGSVFGPYLFVWKKK
jgi:hypothetical protein